MRKPDFVTCQQKRSRQACASVQSVQCFGYFLEIIIVGADTVKPVLSGHSKKTKNWFSRPTIAKCISKVLQNAPRELSAILSTSIKLPSVFKTFVLSIFEWLLKTGFTVQAK